MFPRVSVAPLGVAVSVYALSAAAEPPPQPNVPNDSPRARADDDAGCNLARRTPEVPLHAIALGALLALGRKRTKRGNG